MKVQSQSQLDWEGGILTATTSPALDVSGQGSQAHLHRVSLSRLYHPPDAPEVCSIISAGLKGRATLTDCYLDQAAPAQQCEGNEAKDPRTPPPAQNEAAAGEALRLGDDAVQVHPVRTQAQQPQITVAAALSRGRVELVGTFASCRDCIQAGAWPGCLPLCCQQLASWIWRCSCTLTMLHMCLT